MPGIDETPPPAKDADIPASIARDTEVTAAVAAEATARAAADALLVPKSLYDAQSILAAVADNTPAAVTMGASTILARLASGDIKAASVDEIKTLLGGADLTDIGVPGTIVPPASIFGDVADNAWFAANNWCAMRFYLPVKCTMRYGLLWITNPSGNVQMAVVRLSGANRLSYTKVMDSGILLASGISVVDGGAARLDMGATALTPGDYALVVWADNTTVKIPNSSSDHVESARLNAGGNNVGGVQASGTFAAWNSRYVCGAALEADV